jgi:hypothetical protein
VSDDNRAEEVNAQGVRWVPQSDPNGCCVAVLAMVTGHPYEQIKAFYGEDLGERGLSQHHIEHYLVEHGFTWARKTKWLPYIDGRKQQQREPWPAEPWADVHICEVVTSQSHAVVMLADGTVLDPLTPEPKKLSDYKEVYYVAAVGRL